MATRQQQPWATGKHKPRPARKRPTTSAAGRRIGTAWKDAKRSWAKTTRRHPWINLLLQVLLGLVAVVALVLGVVLESVLYYLVVAVAGLGALAVRRAAQMERTRQGVPPRPSTGGPRPKPQPEGAPKKPADAPTSGPVKCTETGKPIDGDAKCPCSSRHVATAEGASRYGRPVGSPIGRKAKK